MKNKTTAPQSTRHPERSRRVLAFLKNASTSLSMTVLTVCMLCATTATAQTNVSGFISANTTWNLAGSPYVVVGNILLSQGYTLTIDPGVFVKFNNGTALQIDGELHAVGTASNRITFTSNQPNPVAGNWGKIQFSDTCVDAQFDAQGNYLSGCILKYCNVLYGGGIGNGVVHIMNSSVHISNCNINHSAADGIKCSGFVKLDTSTIRNCAGTGMIFTGASPYCPYVIQSDTFEFNLRGGLSAAVSFSSCTGNIIINKNYFNSNAQDGALGVGGSPNLLISENYFVNNSNDLSYTATILLGSGDNITLECNRFINNDGERTSAIAIGNTNIDTLIIRHNVFDGNYTTDNNSQCSMINASFDCCNRIFINNNYIANNSTVGGGTLHLEGDAGANDITKFYVNHNEFINNIGVSNIYFYVPFCDFSLQPADISNNNFLNSQTQFEIDNHSIFGGPNIQADSNYWNSTSTQHVDSVINDFFDYANYSVVFYSPILTTPVMIDTSCIPQIPTEIKSIEVTSDAILFPNPFTTTATLKFSRAVYAATMHIYNMYGQLVAESSGINGESFQVNAEGFRSGVYVYEVTEKDKKICGGKAVVY